jgi:protein transport protein SEC24
MYPPRGPFGAPPGSNAPPSQPGGNMYRPPGSVPPQGGAGAGGPGFFNPASGGRTPPTSNPGFNPPSTGMMPPPSGNNFAPPPTMGGQSPGMMAPPPSYGQQPSPVPGPPGYSPGPSMGGYSSGGMSGGPPPPTGMGMPPPSYSGANAGPSSSSTPGGGMMPPPATKSVPFFNLGGGGGGGSGGNQPSPVMATSGGMGMPPPPSSSMGMAPPSMTGMPPPPMGGQMGGGGMMMPPPPTTGNMGGMPGGMGTPGMMSPQGPPQYSVNYGGPGMGNPAFPTGFDSGSNLAGMGGQPGQGGGMTPGVGGMQGGDPMMGGGMGGAPPLPTLDEMDLSIQCNPMFLRSSVSKIASTQGQANASRLPLGILCKPLAGDKGLTNDDVEVVDFGATGIIRCKRCRTYINPYVSWTDNGRRWRCNICGMLNDVPSTYFSHLDNKGQRRDRDQRPELSKCSVEFIAPGTILSFFLSTAFSLSSPIPPCTLLCLVSTTAPSFSFLTLLLGDYMVRPPQPPVFFFVIDVSEPAVASGMIQSTVNAIKASIDDLPGIPRTQIGFITFDAHIHFYNLKSSLKSPQMIVVSDIHDVIIPLPDDLLVNLQESRAVVDGFLDALPTMFKNNTATTSCTGPALMAAKRVIQHVGGKLLLFQTTMPSLGEGALKMRENPRLLGTDKEHTLLNPEGLCLLYILLFVRLLSYYPLFLVLVCLLASLLFPFRTMVQNQFY